MNYPQNDNKIAYARQLLIEKSRFVIDYKRNKIVINEALYKFMGRPNSIELYYDINHILIMPNGVMPLSQSLSAMNDYEIRNCRTLLNNIRFIFDTQYEEKAQKYTLFKIINTYYFNAAIIKIR